MIPRTWPRPPRRKSSDSLRSLAGFNASHSAGDDAAVTCDGCIFHVDEFLDDHLPIEYFRQDVIRLIHRLRIPGWSPVTMDLAMELDMTRISGALTNSVYSVKPPQYVKEMIKQEHSGRSYHHKLPPVLLLRVYGPQVEFLIDREKELSTAAALTRRNIGPRLMGTFKNGRFEQFLNAKPITRHDLRTPETSIQIAKRMRDLHINLPLSEEQISEGCCIWSNFWKWEPAARNQLEALERKTPGTFQRVMHTSSFDEFLNTVRAYQLYLEEKYGGEDLVFCHNDTQYGNILRLEPPKGSPLLQPQNEHRQLVVIDFEYSGPNYPAYDIANHFCEWMGDYHHTTMPHHIWLDQYPNEEEQTRFITSYVEQGASELCEEIIEPQVQKLMEAVREWKPAVSAFWALWGIVQTPVDTDLELRTEFLDQHPNYALSGSPADAIEYEEESVFDYLSYSSEKLSLFWDDIKALKLPEA